MDTTVSYALQVLLVMVGLGIVLIAFLSSSKILNTQEKNFYSNSPIGAALTKYTQVIKLSGTPATTISCAKAGEEYTYTVNIKFDATFKSSELAQMNVMPVMYFRNGRERNIGIKIFTVKPNENSLITLQNSFTLPSPPVKYMDENENYYTGTMLLNQKFVMGKFSFKLESLSNMNKICHAFITIECANASGTANLYLIEQNKECNIQYDTAKCSKSFGMCDEDISVVLLSFRNPNEECEKKVPLFQITSKGKLDKSLGDVVDIVFWKTHEKTPTGGETSYEKAAEECWSRNILQLTEECEKLFLGGFSVVADNYNSC